MVFYINCQRGALNKDSFLLSGKLEGDYKGWIYLNYGNQKDSTQVINQQFSFKGTIKRTIQGYLHLETPSSPAWVYIENSNIYIDANHTLKNNVKDTINLLIIDSIKGSKFAKIKKEYQQFYQKNKAKNNFKRLLKNKLKTFLSENAEHPFTGSILGELSMITPIFSKEELIALQKLIDTTKQEKDDLKMFEMGIANMNRYAVGAIFPNFELLTPDNKQKQRKNFKSKNILVDFWASWCAPCREKHPKLIALKKLFSEELFDIISISTDEKQDLWLKAIQKDKLKWVNVLDVNKELSNELNIPGIPFNYLINEKGVIIDINISIERLKTRLHQISIK